MNDVMRQEKKFLIFTEQYLKYSHNLSKVLHLDKHSQGDGYLVRSLYFDTLEDNDFQEKEDGVDPRRKIRLRNYGPDNDFAMLELKQKHGLMQKKRSLKLNRADAEKLIEGDYSVLLDYDNPFAAECYGIMNMFGYRPKAVVSYQRKAFVTSTNNIRVTFDHNLKGTESNFDIFSKEPLENSILDPYLVVLEVKFNGFLLGYIKDLLQEVDKSETAVSKYCIGRAIGKHYKF